MDWSLTRHEGFKKQIEEKKKDADAGLADPRRLAEATVRGGHDMR